MTVLNAMRARRFNGAVYIRKEDVLTYLRDTARDWTEASNTKVTIVTADCVNHIADQLAKVTA